MPNINENNEKSPKPARTSESIDLTSNPTSLRKNIKSDRKMEE